MVRPGRSETCPLQGARLRDALAAWPDLPRSTLRKRLRRLMAGGLVEADDAGYRVRFAEAAGPQASPAFG